MSSLTSNRLQGTSYEPKHLVLPKITILGTLRLYLPVVGICNIGEVSLDKEVEIALFSASTYKAKNPTGITRKNQVPTLFLFETGAD